MAITLNCCRCHDHKYDPISQKEFYQLFAFFNSIDESGVLEGEGKNTPPLLQLPNVEHQRRLNELQEALSIAESKKTELRSSASVRQEAWEVAFAKQMDDEAEAWSLFDANEVKSLGGATLTKQPDSSWLASGKNPSNDTYQIEGTVSAGSLTGILLEAFPDPSLPNESLGRYSNGNFVLSDVEVIVTAPSLAEPIAAEFSNAVSDYDQPGWPVRAIVEGRAKRKGKNSKGCKLRLAQASAT